MEILFINLLRKLLFAVSKYRTAVLIDNSVVSYVAVEHNPTDSAKTAMYRRVSIKWWLMTLKRHELIISQTVWGEASRGKVEENRRKRQGLIMNMERLTVNYDVRKLARELLKKGVFRQKARRDAIIVATCCINHVRYLVTWNMKDLADNKNKDMMIRIVEQYPYNVPEIITPAKFLTKYMHGGTNRSHAKI